MTGVGRTLLDGAFVLVWVVVAVEAIVLLAVLRLTVRLKAEMYEAMPDVVKHDRLAGGTLVEFEALDLSTGAMLRSSELRGAPAALLFTAPHQSEGRRAEWLLDTIAGLRSKGGGRLYVLCEGSGAACSGLSRLVGPDVPVLLDRGGKIRGQFLVTATPAAVLLDSDARIAQYGMPERVPDWEKEVI
ncbi:MAG TPA: hypothetical protein VGO86_15085 [Candidatus Dormibacteraeota bacterium]